MLSIGICSYRLVNCNHKFIPIKVECLLQLQHKEKVFKLHEAPVNVFKIY
jgi:hypothetical protein